MPGRTRTGHRWPGHAMPSLEAHVAEAPLFRRNIAATVRRFATHTPAMADVLDAGAGNAPYRELFDHCRYTTADWPYSQHAGAREADIVADLVNLPVPDDSFDAILLTEVLEHVAQPAMVLAELSRLLRPRGRILITVPFVMHLHEEPHDYARYTKYALEGLAQDVGITPLEVGPLGAGFSVLGVAFQHAINQGLLPLDTSRGPVRRWVAWRLSRRLVSLAAYAHHLDRLDPDSRLPVGWFLVGALRD